MTIFWAFPPISMIVRQEDLHLDLKGTPSHEDLPTCSIEVNYLRFLDQLEEFGLRQAEGGQVE